MATRRIELTEIYQEISTGAFLLQVVTPATAIRIHIGDSMPGDDTEHCHCEYTSISYPGTEKAFARAHSHSASIVVTEVS